MPYKVTNLNGVLQQEYQADPRLIAAMQSMQNQSPIYSAGQGAARVGADLLKALTAKRAKQEYLDKQQEQYGAIADALAPAGKMEDFKADPVTLSNGTPLDSSIAGASVENPNRDRIMAALDSGMMSPKDAAPSIMAGLGIGPASEYDTTPRIGMNPSTGKREQFVMDKGGNVKWLGVSPESKVEVTNGLAYDPFNTKPGTVIDRNDPNKAFNPVDGTPNTAYQQYEEGLRVKGAPKNTVNVNAGSSFGSALGGGAADILKASQQAAQGAASTITQGNEILSALDSGKVMAGPATTLKVAAGQIFGGDQEKLNATRQVIKGLAETTLQSRKMLAGQGAVSNNEQALLERARSGDIDGLSLGEIRTIVNVNNRISAGILAQHGKTLAGARKAAGNDAAPFLDMYNVDAPAVYAPRPAPVGNDGWGQPRVKGPR